MRHYILKMAVALAACALLVPTPAKAQDEDCGINCVTCMIFGKEGTNFNMLALNNMTCAFESSCLRCGMSRAGAGAAAEALLTLIKTGAESDVLKAIQMS